MQALDFLNYQISFKPQGNKKCNLFTLTPYLSDVTLVNGLFHFNFNFKIYHYSTGMLLPPHWVQELVI